MEIGEFDPEFIDMNWMDIVNLLNEKIKDLQKQLDKKQDVSSYGMIGGTYESSL